MYLTRREQEFPHLYIVDGMNCGKHGVSYYRTRSYSSNNSSFLFYLEVISYH